MGLIRTRKIKKASKSNNSIAKSHPELASEAYGWDPKIITFGSNKDLPWRCLRGHIFIASPNSRTRTRNNTKCPQCSNLLLIAGQNDLLSTHPELAAESDGWDPTQVTSGMGLIRDWTCNLGHKYQAKISHRASGSMCPYCTNRRVLPGFNDLATTHPVLAAQAFGWDPTEVTYGSGKLLRWRCSIGHIFITTPNRRTNRGKVSFCPVKSENKEHL